MKYKHGQRVTCEIDGTTITDAKISIDKNGTPFICQNKKFGTDAEDKLGYLCSWVLNKDFTRYDVKNLKPLEKTFYNLEAGDIIVDEDGERAKVIDVLPNSFLKSLWENFKITQVWYTPQEAIEYGWTIEGAEPEEEMTLQQVCYMKTLKDICHYSGTGYCPGCGITPEALQDLLTSPTIKAKAEEREKIINMFNGEIALGLRRRLQKPKS